MTSKKVNEDISKLPHLAQLALGYAGIKVLAEDPKKRKEQISKAESTFLLGIVLLTFTVIWGGVAQATYKRPLLITLAIASLFFIAFFLGHSLSLLNFISLLSLTLLIPAILSSIFQKPAMKGITSSLVLLLVGTFFLEFIQVIPRIGFNHYIIKRESRNELKGELVGNFADEEISAKYTQNLFSTKFDEDSETIGDALAKKGVKVDDCQYIQGSIGCKSSDENIYIWENVSQEMYGCSNNDTSCIKNAWAPISQESRSLFEEQTGINFAASGFSVDERTNEQNTFFKSYQDIYDPILNIALTRVPNLSWQITSCDYGLWKECSRLSDLPKFHRGGWQENLDQGKEKIIIEHSPKGFKRLNFVFDKTVFQETDIGKIIAYFVFKESRKFKNSFKQQEFAREIATKLGTKVVKLYDTLPECTSSSSNREMYEKFYKPNFGNFYIEFLNCHYKENPNQIHISFGEVVEPNESGYRKMDRKKLRENFEKVL